MPDDTELSDRYTVTHKRGEPIDPDRRFFVLSPDTDPAARLALFVYAEAIRLTHPRLAWSIAHAWALPLPVGLAAGVVRDKVGYLRRFLGVDY